MGHTRVAVTGMGVITPIACHVEPFAEGIFQGKVGTGPITGFDTSPYSVKNGGEVKGYNPEQAFKHLPPERFDRTTQFAVGATRMALEHANIDANELPATRTGVAIGTTMGNQQTIEKRHDTRLAQGGDTAHVTYDQNYHYYPAQTITATVAAENDFRGPNMVIPTACAAGNYAIGYASDQIKLGKADYMLCGGADALSRACFTMFARLGAISPDWCRPFDQHRKGMMVAEGAAVLLLERYDLAVQRGATIYAEIAGYANSCDAHHITSPHPEGYGAVIAMNKALENSGLNATDIDYISAHGTGTKANDTTEFKGLQKVFQHHVHEIPVSSIKSLMGHTMGAAGAIEAVASVLAIHESKLPVNQNLETLDPEINLNVVNRPTDRAVDFVLSNSFAFGGNISSLILKKPCVGSKEEAS
ncbi:beta-ketoacyl-[acyl-carrier-protein] synthase family protein [Caldalkalibacillus salinus]|uniref:beta-ketoacyl-[acyl-carrier-protein] synthase family protein n=1 Tax=Caldalkalibacillus salinus TaxID=2803787 RepID=UPI0019238DC3|nr:beta-ketoacyl-[acyl-carrier-protein] synthase family protein [Caldalkalibacillus salinus]